MYTNISYKKHSYEVMYTNKLYHGVVFIGLRIWIVEENNQPAAM